MQFVPSFVQAQILNYLNDSEKMMVQTALHNLPK